MDTPVENRRRISYTASLDAAIRSASQIFSSPDTLIRSSASRVLYELQKLRGEIPARRQDDLK